MLHYEKTAAVLSGATSGLCVDLVVYPIDTIKTRLQSITSSVKPTGRLHLFAGLPAVLFGSAPGAALFFCAYEATKSRTSENLFPWASSMLAASVGELVACIIRVPCETIKQRAQNKPHLGVTQILFDTIRSERSVQRLNQNRHGGDGTLSKAQFALCGGLAGAFAGACTTPLDVIKTRIMLADRGSAFSTSNVFTVMRLVYRESGVRGLFAGLVPRVSLLAIGGSIFLGLYDITKAFWNRTLDRRLS